MSLAVLGQLADLWVSQYLAAFCLLTILAWAAGAFICIPKWEQLVRDSVTYLLTIGAPTLILALRANILSQQPGRAESPMTTGIIWFCFALLLIMELLWISYLVDHLVRAFRGVYTRPTASRPTGSRRSDSDYRW